MARPRVLVIHKPSNFQRLIGGRSSKRVASLIESGDPTVARMKAFHEEHVGSVARAKKLLGKMDADVIYRSVTAEIDAQGYDLVVTLGGDGTLLTASRAVGADIPMLAVNTAPQSSIGYFCAADSSDLEEVVPLAVKKELRSTVLTRMEVVVDGHTVSSRVLNDMLFSASSPAATTRYILSFRDVVEEQKSSGLWVGPAAGSTAAQRSAGGKVLPIGSQKLQYVVREPYYGDREPYALVRGLVEPGGELSMKSKTPDSRIWLDGPHLEFDVQIGSEIVVRRSPEALRLLGLRRQRVSRNPGARDEIL